ncbi:hypothetical protein [Jiangella mangrovi]|uniref:Uncharacterized protein n=1 Tax=Jiangella mangrovi TaxID=1524084 RepID=A0A7W9LPJ3_9ACTN|nr:hypothetical protein [Jiangella mangrovi]MBB5791473.1 hypothetical protein [Jiangella mangrovi]
MSPPHPGDTLEPPPEPSPWGVVVFVEVDEAPARRSGSTAVVDGRAVPLTPLGHGYRLN